MFARAGVAIVAGVAVTMALPTAASAVWGGQPDEGGVHPGVGAILNEWDGEPGFSADDLLCSGSYLGTHGEHDVFLTAGHCLAWAARSGLPAEDFTVTFDLDLGDGVSGEITAVDYAVMPDTWHDQADPRDLGVVLLPAGSVEDTFGPITPATLPPAGYLDSLKKAKQLNGRMVDIVGYGWSMMQQRGTGHPAFDYDGKRRYATSEVSAMTRAHLVYIETINGKGTGAGLCFGDSGSPQFDQNTLTIVGVTSSGNRWCNALTRNYRVDTPAAREFLGQYVSLP